MERVEWDMFALQSALGSSEHLQTTLETPCLNYHSPLLKTDEVYLGDSRKSEIGDFADIVQPHKDVARGQVTMNVVVLLQVSHSCGDLRRNFDQSRILQILALTCKIYIFFKRCGKLASKNQNVMCFHSNAQWRHR